MATRLEPGTGLRRDHETSPQASVEGWKKVQADAIARQKACFAAETRR